MKKYLFFIIAIITILSFFTQSYCNAQTLEKNLAESRGKEQKININIKNEKKTLNDLRSEMVKKTTAVRAQENKLLDIDERLNNLRNDVAIKQEKLEQDRASMGSLLMALQRIARVPPEMLIARPDTPINTARSSMLVKTAIPALKEEAEQLTKTLVSLEKLKKQLARELETRREILISLKTEQTSLQGMLKKRETFYTNLLGDKKKQEEETTRLRIKSKDISGLLTALKGEKKLDEKSEKSDKPFSFLNMFESDNSFLIPVAGRIKTHFGEEDDHGLKSKGITIRASTDSTVVSPLNGKIRFAGPFKNYKLILIIEHENGYHSLIAGLSEIYTRIDADIYSGEPIGKITTSDNGETSLYFELRHNGTPTNPEKKLRKG